MNNFNFSICMILFFLMNTSNVFAQNLSDLKLDYHLNEPFPTFEFISQEGDTITNEDLKGKVFVINVWSKICGGCIFEMPDLNQLKEDYGDKVVFIGLTIDSKEEVERFLEKHEFNFMIIPEVKDFLDEHCINTMPLNLFVDKNGIVNSIEFGFPIQRKESGEVEIIIYKKYAEILDEILK